MFVSVNDSRAAPVWHKTVVTRGVNRVPFVGPGDNNYFNLDYLLKPFGIWEPIGIANLCYVVLSSY